MRVKDGAQIRHWRNERGFTQKELAVLCKCSQNAISLIEKGDLPTISTDLALTVSRRLGVPVQFLFEERGTVGVRRMAHGSRTTRQVGLVASAAS